jgi:hypothetical protein
MHFKLRHFLFISTFCSIFVSSSFSQVIPVDTVDSPGGKILLYSNFRWEYLSDKLFDGVMNQHLQRLVDTDTNLHLINYWDTEICYDAEARARNYELINDTIWLCAVDSMHKNFVMPVEDVVTSRYGWRKGRMHYGIDINVNTGDTILAAFSGRVRYAQYNEGGYGNLVIIRHYNGLETYYAHLSQLNVVPNQLVEAGQLIGLGGNTGRSFGAHLHFEIRFFDLPINPEFVIDFEKGALLDDNIFIHKGLFTPSSSTPNNAETSAAPAAQTQTRASAKYHKIRRGETLSSIARKHNTTIAKICKLNGIRQNSVIQAGKTIRVR